MNSITEALGLRYDELREEIETHTSNMENAHYQMNESRREMAEYKKLRGEAEAKASEIRLHFAEVLLIWRNQRRI